MMFSEANERWREFEGELWVREREETERTREFEMSLGFFL